MQQSLDSVQQELAAEHKELMCLVIEIESVDGLASFVRLLERLHALLIRHFSHEQFPGGLYERMGAYGSEYHPELQDLIQDHCTILSEISTVLERAKANGSTDQSSIKRDLCKTIQRLRQHEKAEHALVERLLTPDQSAGSR